ncbi:WhiB family transcriptional regulator [Natronoglycomyces albus]
MNSSEMNSEVNGLTPSSPAVAGKAVAAAAETGAELPCHSYDADLWFSERPTELEFAKSLCADCPIKVACLAGALERREPWGVWGGEIFEQGVMVARKRPRGRPRKNAIAAEEAAQADLEERSAKLFDTVGVKA